MKLGVMGGTFNPPHIGHLEAARHVREALGLDKVLFIPTNLPPHKQMPRCSATAVQRCEMVQLMLQGQPWAMLSTMEIVRGGASYTVDTLDSLQRMWPHASLTLIIGTDMLLSFPAWRQPDRICDLADLAVVARQEGEQALLLQAADALREQFQARIQLVDCPTIPVSSTQLRGSVDEGVVPPAVAKYIRENRLYQ